MVSSLTALSFLRGVRIRMQLVVSSVSESVNEEASALVGYRSFRHDIRSQTWWHRPAIPASLEVQGLPGQLSEGLPHAKSLHSIGSTGPRDEVHVTVYMCECVCL